MRHFAARFSRLPASSGLRSLAVCALTVSTALWAGGCGESSEPGPYDEASDAAGLGSVLTQGKADGLLDGVPVLSFGKAATGYVSGEQLDLYALDLLPGDKFTVVESVLDGTLNPGVTLYQGTSTYVGSETFKTAARSLTKTYAVKAAGRHYLAVRAYRKQGAGNYSLLATCNGGPCNGDPLPEVDLDEGTASLCIGRAQACAFKAFATEGVISGARAQLLLDGCLDRDNFPGDGTSCGKACAQSTDAGELCTTIKDAIVFYSGKGAACRAELDTCLGECRDGGENAIESDEFWRTTESICWINGFNGTCDGYARDHRDCGGTEYGNRSKAACHALCESTFGAWNDDLDTICVEQCDG